MENKQEISQLLNLPSHFPTSTPGSVMVQRWLEAGTPYGTIERLHDISNHAQRDPEIQDQNRATEKKMLSEMERYLADGKFDYFLFGSGSHGIKFILVSAVNALAGTMTSRSFLPAVCETGSPFLRLPDDASGMLKDVLEDWFLYGIKADPQSAPASTAL